MTSLPALLATLAVAAAASATVIAIARQTVARHFADLPNERSLHRVPVPRVGGLGVVSGIVAASFVAQSAPALVLAALVLAAVSAADDYRGLPVSVRFGAHFAAATWLVGAQLDLPWHPLVLALTALGVVWATNLYNFMDGADGLAGGMAVSGFGAYAAAALLGPEPAFALLPASIVAATLAFLAFNFPPARVFLGDAGSIPLGFLAAAIGLDGIARGAWPVWFPLLVFSPFALDATITLLRRAARGERLWQAHRSHYYQRLVLMGWTHRKLAIAAYTAMFAVALAALVALELSETGRLLILVLVACGFAGAFAWTDARWARTRAAGSAG